MGQPQEKFDRVTPCLRFSRDQLQEKIASYLPESCIKDISLLGGGYGNTNYKVTFDRGYEPVVMRFAQKGPEHLRPEHLRKEIAVLNLIKERVPVARPLVSSLNSEMPFVVLEYIDGVPLSEILHTPMLANGESIGAVVGEALAKIHTFDLGSAGFINGDLRFEHAFENLGQGFIDYMRACMDNERFCARVPADWLPRLHALLAEYGPMLVDLKATGRLVHCDFNPKNIMMKTSGSEWTVAAILDWEYAAAGAGLIDIGNFLRFEDELPLEIIHGFLAGYQAVSGPLMPEWRKISKILDLSAMFAFLVREKEYPTTFATARSVIGRTLESLSVR